MTTTQNPWNLSDFDTPGFDTMEPSPGARVYFVYGAGCGEAFGRLGELVHTRWGAHWTVTLDDGTPSAIGANSIIGRAVARPFRGESVSDEPVVTHEPRGIGCYLLRVG